MTATKRRPPDHQGSAAGTTATVDFLLIGGGLASASAAETLRLEGAEGSIAIVGAENWLPYHRPALFGQLKDPGASGEPRLVLKASD